MEEDEEANAEPLKLNPVDADTGVDPDEEGADDTPPKANEDAGAWALFPPIGAPVCAGAVLVGAAVAPPKVKVGGGAAPDGAEVVLVEDTPGARVEAPEKNPPADGGTGADGLLLLSLVAPPGAAPN